CFGRRLNVVKYPAPTDIHLQHHNLPELTSLKQTNHGPDQVEVQSLVPNASIKRVTVGKQQCKSSIPSTAADQTTTVQV
ncbi:hypothetical protein SeMB42_g07948, partial [Synchytrium endobioticum]